MVVGRRAYASQHHELRHWISVSPTIIALPLLPLSFMQVYHQGNDLSYRYQRDRHITQGLFHGHEPSSKDLGGNRYGQ